MKNADEEAYNARVKRLISRWTGEKGAGRTAQKRRLRSLRRIKNVHQHVEPGRDRDDNNVEFISEQRRTRVAARCQVLVVGGGPAGISAALASARAGADTMIVAR